MTTTTEPRQETADFIKNIMRDVDGDFAQALIDPDATQYHQNYIYYLKHAWANHLGVVVSPDIIWHLFLCEFAQLVEQEKETYRSLFSRSDEKQTILVYSEDRVVMPMESLVDAMRDYVPTDVDLFLPNFSTDTELSRFVLCAAFADLCSPYYDYAMYCCDIPFVRVQGTQQDWLSLYNSAIAIRDLMPERVQKHRVWATRFAATISTLMAKMDDQDWLRGIFSLEECGSGSDTFVRGWITKLFYDPTCDGCPKSENFSSCVSKVSYKDLPTEQDYLLKAGLFSSHMDGDVLVPEWGWVVYNTTDN